MPASSLLPSLFSLQNELRDLIHHRCQEVVWYADSRFRQALLKIKTVHDSQRKLMQIDLQQELELVLGIIGKCTATGVDLEIPIILRSLTDSLAYIDHQDLPLKFGVTLLKALDAGVTSDKPYALDKKYDLDWWNHRHDRKRQQYLTRDNLWPLTLNRHECRKDSVISAKPHSATSDNHILLGQSSAPEDRQFMSSVAARAAMLSGSESDSDDREVTAAEAALAWAGNEDTNTNVRRDVDVVNVAPSDLNDRQGSLSETISGVLPPAQRASNADMDKDTVGRETTDPPEATAAEAEDSPYRQLDDRLKADDIRARDSERWVTDPDAARVWASGSDESMYASPTSPAPPINTLLTPEDAELAGGSDNSYEEPEFTAFDAAAAWASESE